MFEFNRKTCIDPKTENENYTRNILRVPYNNHILVITVTTLLARYIESVDACSKNM